MKCSICNTNEENASHFNFYDIPSGTDREAVEMAHYLLRNDGLFVGSSAAMNCVGAVKLARMLGPGESKRRQTFCEIYK